MSDLRIRTWLYYVGYRNLAAGTLRRLALPPARERVHCRALRVLKLGFNALRGELPDLTQWPALETAELMFNNFTGTLPANIGMLANLAFLDINDNSYITSEEVEFLWESCLKEHAKGFGDLPQVEQLFHSRYGQDRWLCDVMCAL